ncbi:MAG TPA: N-acetylmuramoyl-L-alanine amidase [Bacteroidales bacterium]|nr:N-acetylmuramoyl-L-alanine amidase [Bacteroidales bacterium]
MKHEYNFLSTFNFYLVLFALSLFSANAIKAQHLSAYSVSKIVIDAGHGGKDPGTVGKFSKEKDITLSIAKRVGELINQNLPDIKVVYTRTDDTFIPLDERSIIANREGADLFISIHCNAAPNKGITGTETYVMGLHRSNENLDVAMRENAVITYEDEYHEKYEGYDPNSAESFIIFTMLQNAFLEQSLDFASIIQADFKERARRPDRGVKQAGFLVLWKTSMPSVLVEVGYLSNPKEEVFLNSKEGQELIASSIYRAIKAYKQKVDAIKGSNQITAKPDSLKPENTENELPTITNDNTIEFKVQIASTRTPINNKKTQLNGITKVDTLVVNGVYKYLVGGSRSYSEALEYCKVVKQRFPDAFIVAIENGELIPIKKALEKINSN